MGVLQRVLGNLGIRAVAVASGRTDRDVHATGQVVHVDLPPFWNHLGKLKTALNHQLPAALHVKRIEEVRHDFHARYSAKVRTYRYIISTKAPNPFEARFVTFVDHFDFTAVHHAIRLFEGEHDFVHFMKTGSDTQSSVRTIFKTRCYHHRDYYVLQFQGNGFLRSQIRLMSGFLLQISEGVLSETQLLEQLSVQALHSRHLAPAAGLYLSRITYDASLYVP